MQTAEVENDSTPLVGRHSNHAHNGSRNDLESRIKQSCWNCRLQFASLIVLIAAVAWFPTANTTLETTTSSGCTPLGPNEGPPVLMVPEEPSSPASSSGAGTSDETNVPPRPMYRPFCLTHYRSTTARILQTSMGNPSQQWSHIPCYSQPEKVRRWVYGPASNPMPNVHVNGYGAPDAILKANLSIAPFANREPILGFGAAFTEAATLNYQSLSDKGKETLMELFFGKSGLGYSLGRVHVNSCDFSVTSYNFDDKDGDFELKHFDRNVTHDSQKDGMIDMILRATTIFNTSWNSKDGVDGKLKVYASPWSPPSWMKNPLRDDPRGAEHASGMTGSTEPSCLREGTEPNSRYAKAWALYFSKFITSYSEKGIPLWAVTVQNEPEFPAPWEACSYTPETEADFLAYHLGPQLEQDHPDVKIFMFDHNKDHVITWAEEILNQTSPSSQYVSGTAIHWYAGGMDRLLDGAVGIPNMHHLQQKLDALNVSDDHIVLGSEACHCPYTGYGGGDIEVYWSRAERYAHTILADLSAGSNGWVEWNLVLDAIGGPNHLNNLCDATVLAVPHRAINGSNIPTKFPWEKTNSTNTYGVSVGDSRTREELNALGFPAKHLDSGLAVQPMYYYMGHISRYVRPGSRVVMSHVDTAKDGFRAFRSPGQVVAGGGMNDLARVGVEVTVWPCEGSTRQQFQFNDANEMEVSGHDWLGHPTKSCIGAKIDKSFLGITLSDCNPKRAGQFRRVQSEENDGYVTFLQTNAIGSKTDRCLILRPLKNFGGAYGPKGGAQVTYGNCTSPAALWKYNDSTREVVSNYLEEGEVCMTTGWPFFQMGAFVTPNGECDYTVVLLNEARDSANYVLYDGDDPILSGSIPPRSIQTVLLDSN